jgi:hydroxymethylpyrimidine pyrophosphatase-like HAD family hydrolase
VVWDLDRGCIGRHHGLDREVALRIVAAVQEVAPEVAWSWEAHDAFGFEPAFDARVGAPRTGRWDGGAVGPARTTMPPSLVKLTGHLGPEDPDVLLQAIAVAAEVAGQAATPTTAGVGWLEVGPGGVTKAVSLAEVAAEHGVDATEVVAIGDQLNDVPMLRWAGLGVAMAAAPAAVRAEADRVAHPDGFAATLGALVAAGAFGRGR